MLLMFCAFGRSSKKKEKRKSENQKMKVLQKNRQRTVNNKTI